MKRVTQPVSYEKDIRRAVAILKELGCTDIFLFGSASRGHAGEGSDIDIAIRGCPRGHFFRALGKLTLTLDHPVDLVNLDSPDPLARFLERTGELQRVG